MALGSNNGNATLFQTSTPTNDSLRVANEIFVDRYKAVKLKNISKRKIQTVTLDHAVFELNNDDLSYGEIIKIDTQAPTRDIEGRACTLTQRTYAIMTEVSFAEYIKAKPYSLMLKVSWSTWI